MVASRRTLMLAVMLVGIGLSACRAPEGGVAVGSGGPEPSETVTGEPQPCHAGDVSVSAADISPGSGHRGRIIRLRSTAAVACTLTGYPDVVALAADVALGVATHTSSGYLGGVGGGQAPPTVRLAPGSTASFVVEALAFQQSDGRSCFAYQALEVTLPGDSAAVRLAWNGTDACSALTVHPFVPGEAGSAQ
jgi:hypothetical protein